MGVERKGEEKQVSREAAEKTEESHKHKRMYTHVLPVGNIYLHEVKKYWKMVTFKGISR